MSTKETKQKIKMLAKSIGMKVRLVKKVKK